MKTVLAASAALFAVATSAHAADAIMTPPPAAPAAPVASVYDWTGGYLGIQGGYVNTTAEAFGVEEDFDGGIVGGHAGFNWQSGSFVYGIEADVNYTFNENDYAALGLTGEAGTDWQGSIRARLGYAIDNVLIYGTGGFAATNAYVEVPALGIDEDDTFTGYTVGGGLEYAVNTNWTVRGEYRYSDFGDGDFDVPGLELDLDQHQATLGVSYKF